MRMISDEEYAALTVDDLREAVEKDCYVIIRNSNGRYGLIPYEEVDELFGEEVAA